MSTQFAIPTSDLDWAALISTLKDGLPEAPTVYSTPTTSSIAKTIDHTQLSPTATEADIETLCAEAREYHFATVCVRLPHVDHAAYHLRETPDVGVACVVGFHEGTYKTEEKVEEAKHAVKRGASELDMVINYPLLKQGKYIQVYDDVHAVRKAAPSPTKLKVILETSQLNREEIIAGCVISSMAGADFVKTSSGFNGSGASVENVRLMRQTVDMLGKGCKVKASGGIRTADDCIAMLKSGADRIGASASVKIMKEVAGDIQASAATPQSTY
jgi:deoxyribose-phosphate aldolase